MFVLGGMNHLAASFVALLQSTYQYPTTNKALRIFLLLLVSYQVVGPKRGWSLVSLKFLLMFYSHLLVQSLYSLFFGCKSLNSYGPFVLTPNVFVFWTTVNFLSNDCRIITLTIFLDEVLCCSPEFHSHCGLFHLGMSK